MFKTYPKALAIAWTELDHSNLYQYLDYIGATDYEVSTESSIDALIEVAGKQCYKSWQPGLNPNVSKTRNDNAEYLANINKVSHGSVREHASITFIFWGVSRVFTHELVRHRVGVAISQESLRYVRLTDLGFWMPTAVAKYDPTEGEGEKLITETVEYLEEVQKKLAKIYGIEDMKDFALKKKLTSMFRRVAPIGLSTGIIWTANINTLRHCIQVRTSRHAEEEIRIIFDQVAKAAIYLAPNILGDLKRRETEGIGEWCSPNAAMPYDADHLKAIVKAAKKAVNYGIFGTDELRETLQYWGHID